MESPAETQARHAKAIAEAGAMTEAEMRDAKPPRCETPEQVAEYIRSLVDRPHDYGTCVYAMTLSAVAAFNFAAHRLGVTGFQASCADMAILSHTRRFRWGKLLNYEDLLYPQYCNEKHFPTWRGLVAEHKDKLAEMALEKLAESPAAAVAGHWRWLAGLAPEPAPDRPAA